MEKKEEKNRIKKFENDPPKNLYSRLAYRYLFNRLKTYIRIVMVHKKTEEEAKAEIYRHLVRYMLKIQECIDQFEKDLENLLEDGDRVYFPLEEECIEKTNGKIQIVSVGKDQIHKWVKTYKKNEQ